MAMTVFNQPIEVFFSSDVFWNSLPAQNGCDCGASSPSTQRLGYLVVDATHRAPAEP